MSQPGVGRPCPKCGAVCQHDPTIQGYTVGGLYLQGWDVCLACDKVWLSRHGRPVERWAVSRGGRSIDTGAGRLRLDASDPQEAPTIMARVARLPELERALTRIARGEGDPVAIAREALES